MTEEINPDDVEITPLSSTALLKEIKILQQESLRNTQIVNKKFADDICSMYQKNIPVKNLKSYIVDGIDGISRTILYDVLQTLALVQYDTQLETREEFVKAMIELISLRAFDCCNTEELQEKHHGLVQTAVDCAAIIGNNVTNDL